MIKEFKNGNLIIDLREDIKIGYYNINDSTWIDNFYDSELTMQDYYFNQINGYMYLVNFRTNKLYNFASCNKNIFDYFREYIESENYKLKLKCVPTKTAKSLLQDLENGY